MIWKQRFCHCLRVSWTARRAAPAGPGSGSLHCLQFLLSIDQGMRAKDNLWWEHGEHKHTTEYIYNSESSWQNVGWNKIHYLRSFCKMWLSSVDWIQKLIIMKRNIWMCIDGQKLTEFQWKYIFFSKITPSEKMILEKSWVGDYQSIRYLAENSTPTLAENWLKRLKPSTNLLSTINEYESSKL